MSIIDKGDVIGYDEKDIPKVMACLIHPSVQAIMIHKVKEKEGFMWVTYGLCTRCEGNLQTDKTFARHLDKAICKRLENLNPKGGK